MSEKITAAEYRERYAKKESKPSKYGNVLTINGDRKFQSKGESNRYNALRLMEREGLITNLRL